MTQVNEAGLGADALEVLKVVERFARDEVRPVGMQLDALADPDEVTAPGSPLWTLHDKYRALGVDSLSLAGSFEPAEQAMLSARIHKPWAVYQTSGEQAGIDVLAERGLTDPVRAQLESWSAFSRAGANMIISYAARRAHRYLAA